MQHVRDPEPECQEKIQCKSKSQGDEGEVDERGSHHTGSYAQPLRDPSAYFKAPLLKIVQDLVEVLHGLKILLST